MDELWQYSFANNILNGLIPYKDFNLITTPFFSFLAALFLKVFFNQLITMRIFNTLIFTIDLFLAYKIFRILKINRLKSLLFTLILYFLFFYDLGVEYNYLILLIALIILYVEIYNTNKYGVLYVKNDFILGLLIGIAILTKQTIGGLLSIIFIFYKSIFIKDKCDTKKFIEIACYRIMGVLIPVIVFFIYLLLNNSFEDFLSYAILGIAEFNNKVSYFNLFTYRNILIRIFSFVVPFVLLSIIGLIRYRRDSKFTILIILLIYSIGMFTGMFPIANSGHFIIYAFIGIITTLYIINNILKSIVKSNKDRIAINSFVNFFLVTFIVFYVINTGIKLNSLYKNNNICINKLNHYLGILINENTIKDIEILDNYIKHNEYELGKKTYILDSSAVVYMIPIDKYNKDYDMLNRGNLGKDGEQRIIQEIAIQENTQYLILNDKYKKNWQTPLDIINYVKTNKAKVGEIGIFDIYE